MAIKVDGRGCLNKHQPHIYTRQLLALSTSGWSVECISRPCNITLISPRPSLSLCWWWQ